MRRLGPDVFDIPVHEIRQGYRSAVYFNRAKLILEAEQPDLRVTMQVFQKAGGVLCGIDEAIAILRIGTGYYSNPDKAYTIFASYLQMKKSADQARYSDIPETAAARYRAALEMENDLERLWVSTFDDLEILALHDADQIDPWESVMHINGKLSQFTHLESVYLGVLARRSRVASNTRKVVNAANGKPVLFFADRFDHWGNQPGDGYAASCGGAAAMATDAMTSWFRWNVGGVGTMPHALIASFDGDVVEASKAFKKLFPEIDLVALVDFNNDCVGDSVRCLDEFGRRLSAVRLDTSENMVDQSIVNGPMGNFKPTGVNIQLVNNVREALDQRGGKHVKIIVSGGFNPEKINAFEAASAPVDTYAVGSSLLAGSMDFTADVVAPRSKAGRKLKPNPRFSLISQEY